MKQVTRLGLDSSCQFWSDCASGHSASRRLDLLSVVVRASLSVFLGQTRTAVRSFSILRACMESLYRLTAAGIRISYVQD